MNKAMGINRDKEITQVQCPTADEVEEYEEEEEEAEAKPSLNPMRPCLHIPRSSWNAKLWDLLVCHIQSDYETDHCSLEEMEEAFYSHLARLSRWQKTDDDELDADSDGEEYAARKREKEDSNRRRQRASTRRRTVSFVLTEGCLLNSMISVI